MKNQEGRQSLDRRVEGVRRMMRERRTLVDPGPYFVDRVIASLPRAEGRMLAWAAWRVLPVTLALAAVLTIAVLVTNGSVSREVDTASISSTPQSGNDPLDWLLENRQEVR